MFGYRNHSNKTFLKFSDAALHGFETLITKQPMTQCADSLCLTPCDSQSIPLFLVTYGKSKLFLCTQVFWLGPCIRRHLQAEEVELRLLWWWHCAKKRRRERQILTKGQTVQHAWKTGKHGNPLWILPIKQLFLVEERANDSGWHALECIKWVLPQELQWGPVLAHTEFYG